MSVCLSPPLPAGCPQQSAVIPADRYSCSWRLYVQVLIWGVSSSAEAHLSLDLEKIPRRNVDKGTLDELDILPFLWLYLAWTVLFSVTNWGPWGHGKHLTFTECISRGPFLLVCFNKSWITRVADLWFITLLFMCRHGPGVKRKWRIPLFCSFLLFPTVEKEMEKAGFSFSWWPNCPTLHWTWPMVVPALFMNDQQSHLDSRIYLNVDKPQLSRICLIYFHLMLYFFP